MVVLGGTGTRGTFCSDPASCALVSASQPQQVTSFQLPARLPLGDLLDATDDDLGCCRRVVVPYCSQDLFIGNGSAAMVDGNPVFFEGAAMVDGVFAGLAASMPNGTSLADYDALLAGTGAPSLGASLHFNTLAARYWNDNGGPGGQLRLLGDGGWLMDLSPDWDSSLATVLTVAVEFWGAQDIVARRCPVPSAPVPQCLLQSELASWMNGPAMYLVSLHDVFMANTSAWATPAADDLFAAAAASQALATEPFGGAMASSLEKQAGATQEAIHSVFRAKTWRWSGKTVAVAVKCLQNGFLNRGGWADVRVFPQDATLVGNHNSSRYVREIVSDWLAGANLTASQDLRLSQTGDSQATAIIDVCNGPLCNPTCPVDAVGLQEEIADTVDSTSGLLAVVLAAALCLFGIVIFLVCFFLGRRDFQNMMIAIKRTQGQTDIGDKGEIPHLEMSRRTSILFSSVWYKPARQGRQRVDAVPLLIKGSSGHFQAGQLT